MTYLDTFGKAFMARHLDNAVTGCLIERDDGHSSVESLNTYYASSSQFSDEESAALEHVSGRVLDIGCGAGRILLHFQGRFDVVGMDISHTALRVCRLKGVKHLVNVHAPHLPFGPDTFDAAILMGNNYGLCGSIDATKQMMKNLYQVLSDDGAIIAQSTDLYSTEKEIHLKYHERNRERGRPAGQITLRIGFDGEYSDWFDLLLQSKEEMAETVHPYWKIDKTYGDELYTAVLKKRHV